ncbi:MAG: ABC-F family ATP-binding cassette domain-containing protein, partial [Candidatus Latescibacteria bacterium]|nr:ABC-F family ATP-binding cassette domain-containing protein [Candidatus Latescibacterota bacterium]
MPIIQLDDIWKSYGAYDVLTGVTWQIDPGDRIGLVGHNGCGKTTLFHILTGESLPDDGQMHRQRDLNIGFLAQEPTFDPDITVMDAALEAFADLLMMQHRLHDLEQTMANGGNSEIVLNDYGRLRDQYEHLGGYATEARAKAILFGLGFRATDLELPTQVLSGGQKNRLALAQLLAREPDVLLLDEPTNHLDLQALEWLEYFLSDYPKAFVIISHDRTFLERTVTKIVDLERGQLEHYSGTYSFYIKEKELRRAQQQKAYEAQRAHIERTEDYIRRNIAGQKTKQAQSRRRALEKLDRVERVNNRRDMGLKFATTSRGGDRVLQLEHLCKAYDNRPLFSDLNLTLWRGDRLGIIGPNGSGKSTLLKLIIDQQKPDAGTIIPGKGLEIGYFEQTRQDLNPNLTVIEELWSVTPNVPETEIRTFLGAFLFSGDEVERKTGTLSGGEQSRVALAKLIRSPYNLLLLDEPTNHLDIASRNVLENALEHFSGTMITVSHDRYFLNRMINRLIVFGDGKWQIVEGNYDTYQRQILDAEIPPTVNTVSQTAAYHEIRKRDNRQRQRQERKAAQLEETIADLEEKAAQLTEEMQREDLATDWNRLDELAQEKTEIQEKIDDLFAEWETLDEALQIEN